MIPAGALVRMPGATLGLLVTPGATPAPFVTPGAIFVDVVKTPGGVLVLGRCEGPT